MIRLDWESAARLCVIKFTINGRQVLRLVCTNKHLLYTVYLQSKSTEFDNIWSSSFRYFIPVTDELHFKLCAYNLSCCEGDYKVF